MNTTISKNQLISLRILALRAQGKDIREAMNSVLGAGAFEKLAEEIYDAHRAKAQTSVAA